MSRRALWEFPRHVMSWFHVPGLSNDFQSAPKERRRRRAEKRFSKRVFLESPFLLCPLKVCS